MLALLTLRFSLFLDFVALTIVIPLFAPVILNPTAPLLNPSTSTEMRVIILNLLMATYGLGQFISSPVIGTVSDHIGRKKSLLIVVFITLVSAFITALGFTHNHLELLFLGRLGVGIGSGILAVLSATIYDIITDPTRRRIELGYLTGAGALGYIIGPFLGGVLSDNKIMAWFNDATPLWGLVIGYILLIILLPLVLHHPSKFVSPPNQKPIYYLKKIMNRFFDKQSIPIFIIYFLFTFSAEAYFASFILLSEEKLFLSSLSLGWVFAIGGLSSFIFLYGLNPILMKHFSIRKLFLIEAIILIGIYIISAFIFSVKELFVIMIIFSALSALAWTHLIDIICSQAAISDRGEMMGSASSYRSLSIILGPLVVSALANFNHAYLFLASTAAIFLAALLYVIFDFAHVVD